MKFAELVQIGLLGTDRQAVPAPTPSGALGQLQSQIDLNQRERALLSFAALSGLHERAGAVPPHDQAPLPAVCPAEQLPRATERAGSVLLRLLADEYAELLPEWLARAVKANRLAPPEALPALLNAGVGKAELRESIVPVLGERGRWLAAQNSEWAWVGGGAGADENLWHLGERPARLLFLQRLRRTNPARARELLMQTWKEETPEDRAVFIGTLEVKLSPADEPLLEAALDDKRKEVRRTAANLLACLPDSAFVKRATDRVRPLLKFVPGSAGGLLKLKKAKPAALEVTLPAECDRAMQRDGVEPKPLPGLGEKAWWLIQMLEAVPLVRWQGEWDLPVDEILAASHAGEWKKEFFEAWTRAAIRQKNETWAQALLDLAIDTKRLDKLDGLLAAMSPARREGHLTRLLLNDDDKFRDLQGTLIAQCRHEWSATFSRAVLAFMQGVAAQELGNWQLRNHFKTFAPRLDPGVLAETVSGWPTDSKGWDFWSKGVEEFLAATQFRSDLHHAFSQ